ncbi:MAG TPA: hypothetical protein VFC58_07495 [Desulfosporosinus sp.]|nr:hypothetical protein [Desulfosporosinus sp.]
MENKGYSHIERTNKNSLPLKVAAFLHKRILVKINKVCRIYSMMNEEIHKKEHNKTPQASGGKLFALRGHPLVRRFSFM